MLRLHDPFGVLQESISDPLFYEATGRHDRILGALPRYRKADSRDRPLMAVNRNLLHK